MTTVLGHTISLFRQACLAQLLHCALKFHPLISQPNDNILEILLDICCCIHQYFVC
jgi:hypothetical protein